MAILAIVTWTEATFLGNSYGFNHTTVKECQMLISRNSRGKRYSREKWGVRSMGSLGSQAGRAIFHLKLCLCKLESFTIQCNVCFFDQRSIIVTV